MNYSLSLLGSGVKVEVSSPGHESVKSMDLEFVNANTVSSTQGLDALGFKSNYFIGNDQSKWVKDVPNFAKVRYSQVWNGVDVIFYGNEDRLEYDLVVAPGSNPRTAVVAYPGARLLLNKNGDLVVHTAQGDFLQQKPSVYQMVDNRRQQIAGRYVVAGQRVSFAIGKYDHARELVIDPAIAFSLGRIDDTFNTGTGAAVDPAGNSLIAGTTAAIQQSVGGPFLLNGWLARLDPVGIVRVKFYIGAINGPVTVTGIAVDSKGSAYVTGNTSGTGFPTTRPYQPAYAGGTDAFLIRFDFDSAGNVTSPYGTYLGSSGLDSGNSVAVDNARHAYIAGQTSSSSFPGASAANAGGFDAFVTEFDTSAAGAASLVYSWIGGGSGDESAQGIALDPSGNAYVGGNTTSTNFTPISSTGFMISKTTASTDGFLLKLSPAPAAVTYFTYFPFGPVTAVAAEASGNAYVTGQANAATGAIPTNSIKLGFQLSGQGGTDAFVARFNTTTGGVNSLVYSSYLGGSGNDYGSGIVTDGGGTAFVTGFTGSANFPAPGAVQPGYGGGNTDAFLTILNTNLSGTSSLAFSTFLGGSGDDSGGAIALTPYKNPVIVGNTTSANIGNPADGRIDKRAFATKIVFEAPPFGVVDTPVNGASGQAGAINFTGWALSRLTVTNIALCRETIPGEAGINGLVYLGNGVLTPGARPDVAAAHPGYPNNNWGWGAQILTNQLPGTNGLALGNGTYRLHAIAADPEGTASVHDSRDCSCTQRFCTDLGVSTISVNNAGSILPFGTIDTPGQGQTISGTDFVNFGWVLTPQPNIVPIDASTIMVYIDGVAVGHPVYNNFRQDIATLFPGLRNSNGGVGYFHLNTTTLSNGIHNIAWGVTDSAGNAQGIGSRAFFVQN